MEEMKKKIENFAWAVFGLSVGLGACAIIWFFASMAVILLGE